MPLVPLWHEDFAEWAAAAVIVSFPGTGWSGNTVGGAPVCSPDANFYSGKTIGYSNLHGNPALFAFEVSPPAVVWTLSWNQLRVADATTAPTVNTGNGMKFLTGLSDYWLRIVPGGTDTGQQNTLFLQSRAGAAGTFVTRAQTPNNLFLGVKYPCAITIDWATGGIQWIVNGDIIYSGTLPAFAGLSPTSMAIGRLETGASQGSMRYGDFYNYADSFYVGPVEIRSGFPTANEPLQDWSFVGGPSAWECLNNSLSATPTQYIESATLGDVSQFAAPVSMSNVFQIYSGEHRLYGIRTDVSPVDMVAQYGDSGSVADSPTLQPNQAAYQFLKYMMDGINPNTGIAWQLTDPPASVIGYERTS